MSIWSNLYNFKMKTRGQATFGIRFLVHVLVALFVISFWGILLQYRGRILEARRPEVGQILNGVVLSMKDVRFNHSRSVLQSLGIEVVQKVPPSFESKEVDQGLERHVGSRNYHTAMFLKVWSNRMAFLECMEEMLRLLRLVLLLLRSVGCSTSCCFPGADS